MARIAPVRSSRGGESIALAAAARAVDGLPGSDVVPLAYAWWRRECAERALDPDDPLLTPPEPPGGFPASAEPAAIEACPRGGDGAAWLGARYVEALPRSLRSREGRYYTPRVLAARLVEQAWRLAPRAARGLVVDPACGAGALLGAAAERKVAQSPPDEALRWVAEHLRGRDLDPLAVWLCNLTVWSALLPAWRALTPRERSRLPLVAHRADGLDDPDLASLVLTNPPFGRVRLAPAERLRFASALYGHANRATLFLQDAVARLNGPGAAAAFVMPASVVGGAYFQRLRSLLAEQAPPAWLAFVADREGVFPGEVLQEAVLGVFVRGGRWRSIACERISMNGEVRREPLARVPKPRRPHEPWLLPREPEDGDLIALATGLSHRLDDYGWRVSTGPLVWNRHRDQLSAGPGPGRLPVVWAGDVRQGRLELGTVRAGRWCEVRVGQEWLVLDRPAVLVQRTTAPEQPRRIVAAALDAHTFRCTAAVWSSRTTSTSAPGTVQGR